MTPAELQVLKAPSYDCEGEERKEKMVAAAAHSLRPQ